MTPPAQAVIRATAVPRLDPGAVGIHLAWSGPELTPLAIGGYEVRRRPHLELKTTTVCATFDVTRLALLAETGLLLDELGVMLQHIWRPSPTDAIEPEAENFPFDVFTQQADHPDRPGVGNLHRPQRGRHRDQRRQGDRRRDRP